MAKLVMGVACLAFVLVVWVVLSCLPPFVIVIEHQAERSTDAAVYCGSQADCLG